MNEYQNTKYCHYCGKIIAAICEICPGCGVRQPGIAQTRMRGGMGLIVGGYICGILALLLFPPVFGIAGTTIGIINITKDRIGHGFAQIVISVTFAIFGMIIA